VYGNNFKDMYIADLEVRPDKVVQLFQPLISNETNAKLCKESSTKEISDALF
jgi:hypothetical protein